MAYSIIHTVVMPAEIMAHLSSLAGADPKQNGHFVCGIIDISTYETGGVTVLASEIGLSEVYGIIPAAQELDAAAIFNVTKAADRKSFDIDVWDAATPSEHGTTNVGEVAFIAWGIGGRQTENLTV